MDEKPKSPSIRPSKDGPYLVKGPVELLDADGNNFAPEGNFALCRCGHSKNKPFCDGTHSEIGFEAPAGKANK